LVSKLFRDEAYVRYAMLPAFRKLFLTSLATGPACSSDFNYLIDKL